MRHPAVSRAFSSIWLAAVLYLVFSTAALAGQAKYVFFFIGDGMSASQINVAEAYKALLAGKTAQPGIEQLNFTQFPVQGVTTTYSSESLITDSAAAATAMACGVKTYNAGLGVDASGKPMTSFAEMAKAAGYKVGIVSTVSLDHATPAAFYAHTDSRKNYYEIGQQLAKSGFDYFAGGGFLDPEGKKAKSQGAKTNVLDAIAQAGYTIVKDRKGFDSLKPGTKAVVISPRLQDEAAMPYSIDMKPEDLTLADLTAKGIEMLYNPKGFFMMVESGKVDWACHANDAASAIYDMLAFEKAIDKALQFAAKHPKETLIVVTGDHETGGMSIGFAGTKYSTYLQHLTRQNVSYVAFDEIFGAWRKAHPQGSFEEAAALITSHFGLKIPTAEELADMAKAAADKDYAKQVKGKYDLHLKEHELADLKAAFARSMSQEKINENSRDYLLYGSYEPFTVTLTHILNAKAGIGWTSYSHTGVPVITTAFGHGAETFHGYYDNTAFFNKFINVLGLNKAVAAR